MFELALLAGTWLVLCLEVGAGFAIHVIAANKADPSIVVLRIQGLAIIGNFVAVACGFPLLTLRRYRVALVCNLIALVVSGTLTVTLAPSLGARGAAVAALVAETGLGVSVAVMLKRAAPGVVLPIRTVAAAALAGCVAAIVGFALPVNALIEVAVASITYFTVLKLVGRFPPELREILDGWIRPSFTKVR